MVTVAWLDGACFDHVCVTDVCGPAWRGDKVHVGGCGP
jgi:hypothetical protein